MNIVYVSPSVLPSRSANSVHVIRMAEAIVREGHDLTLYGIRSEAKNTNHQQTIESFYGVKLPGLKLKTWHFSFTRLASLISGFIFAFSVVRLTKTQNINAVISRNFYASFLLSLLCKTPLIYEAHSPEVGWKKHLQKVILSSPNTTTVVISSALKSILTEHLHLSKKHSSGIAVLHDSAPENPYVDKKLTERRSKFVTKNNLTRFRFLAGYFGHLYAGRGVEVILELAAREPEICFVFFGGNDGDIQRIQNANRMANVVFLGHVPHETAIELMTLMDVLFMPYQEKVSIGDPKSDTSRWMSPMKMFEYMSAKVPILSSNLPVLKEVLQHEHNALLAKPNDVNEWHANLKRLLTDKALATKIARTAHEEFIARYTWTSRVRLMLSLLTNMIYSEI